MPATTPSGTSVDAPHRNAVAAAEQGKDLHLAAWLTYIDHGSNHDKYHRSLLVGRHVLVWFGRRTGSGGQTTVKAFPSAAEAQAYYWTLLRGKVGKGYHVEDAIVLHCGEASEAAVAAGRAHAVADTLHRQIERWVTLRGALARRATFYRPDVAVRSPRTAKQGAQVIATLTSPDPDRDVLLQCALGPVSERFLHPMVLAHPRCPEEAVAARALAEMAAHLGSDVTV